MKKVLILTGPAGSGKTTISDLIGRNCGFKFVDGEFIDSKSFPKGGQWLPENLEKLQQSHNEVLAQTKEAFDNGSNDVVLDYIIFGDYVNFFNKFKKEFGDYLIIKVLMPNEQELIKRDKERECWTAGAEHIRRVINELREAEDIIGKDNFIDTTGQTAEETFKRYFGDCKV